MRNKSGSRVEAGAAASDSGAVESWVELSGCSEGVTSDAREVAGRLRRHVAGLKC